MLYIYTDQDVTTVARYVNQKGCYYTLQPFIEHQKYHNKWMSGFFKYNMYIKMREKTRRKELTEYDIPYGVMRLVLLVAYNQMSRVSEVDMCSPYLHCH